jgi:hypothetical protein
VIVIPPPSLPNEATNEDPAPSGWAIDDPVIRFRILGTEHIFDLPTADRWVLGASPECAIRLDDPTGRLSRRHAVALRDDDIWRIVDLDSTNGLRINSKRRRSIQLTPGDEIELGSVTLIAESRRTIELHELLQRWLGWSASRLVEVDRGLREVRAMANLRTALILRGAGDLGGIARRLHQITLGGRPFIPFGSIGPYGRGLERARNGTLYIDAHESMRHLRGALANRHQGDLRVRLVASLTSTRPVADLAEMLSRIAMLSIPPVTERPDEIPRLLEAAGIEAANELDTTWLGLVHGDAERVLESGVTTIDQIEAFALRLVAFRNWGVTEGAKRLGLTHSALSRWARRWRIPPVR